jgi:hypothetical protein
MSLGGRAPCKARRSGYDGSAYKWVVLSNATIRMLHATINSSIILIALDIFRRIHLDPLTPGTRTTYSGLRHACLERDLRHRLGDLADHPCEVASAPTAVDADSLRDWKRRPSVQNQPHRRA